MGFKRIIPYIRKFSSVKFSSLEHTDENIVTRRKLTDVTKNTGLIYGMPSTKLIFVCLIFVSVGYRRNICNEENFPIYGSYYNLTKCKGYVLIITIGAWSHPSCRVSLEEVPEAKLQEQYNIIRDKMWGGIMCTANWSRAEREWIIIHVCCGKENVYYIYLLHLSPLYYTGIIYTV